MEALLRPVVEAQGFDLYDVSRRREGDRLVLQVMIDASGGIDVDELAQLSRHISQHLDAQGSETGAYDLQVSSPGLERQLTRPDHFRRSVGEQVRVKTTTQVEGSRIHTGRLLAADDEACTLASGEVELSLTYAGISSARTVVDWAAELKGSDA